MTMRRRLTQDVEGVSSLITKISATSIDAVRHGLRAWEDAQDARATTCRR